MNELENEEALICNLKDAGCSPEVIGDFMKYLEERDVNAQLRLLERHRRKILERVHAEEKKICCLDYLVYQIRRKNIAVYRKSRRNL